MTRVAIELASVTDWDGFARAVRVLRSEGVAPEQVRWRVAGSGDDDLFDTRSAAGPEGGSGVELDGNAVRLARTLPLRPPLSLPGAFVNAAHDVFLHADAARWPLLHRLVLRIADDARAWVDPLHVDRLQFDRFQREVRREIHKMHAFVRFRRIVGVSETVADDVDDTGHTDDCDAGAAEFRHVRHVAWFEPGHHIVEAAAPFFARRFSTMRWAILTPRVSVDWNGRALAFGPGARREQAPAADAGEDLWLAYYRSIFNPARVKVAMMKKEMPVRFWKNLPEAAAIAPLLFEAADRRQRMIAEGGALREPSRRRGRIDLADDVAIVETPVVPPGHLPPVGVSLPSPAVRLDTLRRQAARCRDCPVADAATQTVFGSGPATARLMLVGEQPGDVEDLRGLPFQGPAGALLRAAFGELGWDADSLYLTNAVKHFHHELRGKRRLHKTPGQREAEACLHWLDAEIATVQPRAIVALGATAARSLLGREVGVLAHEGQWLPRADGIPVLICLHPAAIRRADVSRQPALRARWLASLSAAAKALEIDAAGETSANHTTIGCPELP